jgi:hypothetical protein
MDRNLFASAGLPTIVTLDPQLIEFLGPFASIVSTLLNGLAFLIVILLVMRIVLIAGYAIREFREKDVNGEEVLVSAFRSGVEAFLVAAVAFLTVANGANILYFLARKTGDALIVDPKKDILPQLTGPFAGLVAAIQNLVALGIIVGAAFLAGKIVWEGLSATRYNRGDGRIKSDFAILQDTVKKLAYLAVLTIIVFVTVRFGPSIFFGILFDTKNLITQPTVTQ